MALIPNSKALKLKISFWAAFICIYGCALKPSKRIGVDRKYIIDSIMVKVHGQSSQVFILDSTSLQDLDSLSSVSYFGTESKYHVFFQWSKAAVPPNDVTLFALDSSVCQLEETFPIEKHEQERHKQKPVSFHNLKCEYKLR